MGVGALVVTLNIKLLGGHISFFQSVCVLGYCLLPLGIALAICRIILMASNQSMGPFILRCIFVLLGFIWSTYAATQFLGDCQPPKRKALAAYPMGLFYFILQLRNSPMHFLFPSQSASLAGDVVEIPH